MSHVSITHFSDVLCIWAYAAQVRIDELKSEYASQIDVDCHFISLFADTRNLIARNFADQGAKGINQAALKVAERFKHIDIHPDLWLIDPPASSANAHLFLKAIQLVEAGQPTTETGESLAEAATWQVRLAFFRDGLNISKQSVLNELAERMALPIDAINEKLANGEAHAAIAQDNVLQQKHQVTGSPTLVFNEGRQTIYGNVGYRVIEANIRELLHQPDPQCSWC